MCVCNHIGSFALFSEDIGPFLMTQEQPEMEALPLTGFLSLPSPSLYLLFNAHNASTLLCPESLQLLLSLHSSYFFFFKILFLLACAAPYIMLNTSARIHALRLGDWLHLPLHAFVSGRMYFTHG